MTDQRFKVLKASHQLVAFALDSMLSDGSAAITADALADASGVSRRTVKAATAEIVQRGMFTRTQGKPGQPYTYSVKCANAPGVGANGAKNSNEKPAH